MSSSKAATPVWGPVSGRGAAQEPGSATQQQDDRKASGQGPAFGCVDWYLYPQELLEAAAV
jgi:hypothetical protein